MKTIPRTLLTLTLLAASNFWSGVAFGQNQWTRQSPLPAARNLTGVAWATPTHGFASGERETFIETSDGGATWQNANLGIPPTSAPFYNTYCRDAANCFVIGNSGDHWRTTDSGATWQRITNFPNGGSWRQIDFVSASVGFMGSNGATARTMDGGATWTLMSGSPACPVMFGMDFRDAQVGLVGGNRVSTTDGGPGIFKTSDAGVTWVRKFSQSANDVLWLSDTTAIATVGASIYRSTDVGETWSEISSQISTGLGEMDLLPNGTVVGVSNGGDAWRSADGGSSWTRTLIGLGALPAVWNVSFFDNQIGAIVGQGGFLFKTIDGGLTWAMLNNGIGGVEFRDVEMFDDNAGLAVGDNGYFLRTSNGGARWEAGRVTVTGVVVGRNEHLQAISVVDANFAVVAGYDGVVYKTFDRGVTWQSIGYPSLPDVYFISEVKFINRNLGYVIGNRVNIAQSMFVTTDGGASWTPASINGGHSMDFVDANHGWVVTSGGGGHRTTDGGATWQEMILPNQGFNPSILKTDFINENEGWAVGWHGYAAHTTDGGISWQLQNIATINDQILGLYVLSTTEVFAVGAPSGGSPSLYHTINAGATWQKSALPNQYSLSSIFATQSRKVWTSGYDGAVLHDSSFAGPSPSPSPSPGISPSPSPSPSPGISPSPSPSPSPGISPSPSPSPSPGISPSPSPSPSPGISPSPSPSPSPGAKAINLSTRMRVQTGDNVGIGGFIITGSTPKHVLLRAIGPSLTSFGVPDALADPVLELHGPGVFATITNDNWKQAQETEIRATGIPPLNDLEAAIMATLAPGAYTAIVRGNGNTAGVALVEAYDLNQGVASKLANISTRAFVSTGDNIVIAGFMLGGGSADRIVVRGIGPSLTAVGGPNALSDPRLDLRDTNGALLTANNDWQDDPLQASEITAAGLAPTNNLESAIAAMLPPGHYTALLSGVNNGIGIGVVEVYDRGATP